MFPKRLLAITLLFALALMGAGEARAQWVNVSSGPSTYGLVGHDDVLYAGGSAPFGSMSGFWRSTDFGQSWFEISKISRASNFYSIAFLGNEMFMGTDNAGVLRSDDSGKTWNQVGNLSDITEIIGLAVSGQNLIAMGSGIYVSKDSGQNWTEMQSAGTWEACCSPIAVNGTNVYVATLSGLWYSGDQGITWNLVFPDTVLAVAIDNKNIYISSGGILRSTNEGASWDRINKGLGLDSLGEWLLYKSGSFLFSESGRANTANCYVSSDEGDSWTNLGSIHRCSSLAVAGSNLVAASTNTFIYYFPLSDFGISSVAQSPAQASSEIQVYPNPTSGSTTISLSTKESGYAEVSIVNMLGEEVARLHAGELAAGEHSFEWDKSGVADGMYECLVRMSGEVKCAGIVAMR